MLSRVLKRSFSTVGSLFTWGETTYGWGRTTTTQLRVPGQAGQFKDVVNVCAGPYHLIFLRADKSVYSVGLGTNGRLGHAQPITALANVGVKQIAAGCRHSLALTEKGSVYAWGYGGRRGSIFTFLPFLKADSPIGIDSLGDVHTPQLVDMNQNIKKIAAGRDFSLAIGQSGKVYGWGQGLYSLSQQTSSLPTELEQINYFLDSHHAHVVDIKSSGKSAFFLLDNGRLYVTGVNNGGLFATRQNPRIVDDNHAYGLTKIIQDDFKGQKIVDFAISSNSLIFLTDTGAVYYSGMHTKFRPELFPIQSDRVGSIFATEDVVGVIDKNGSVEYLNDQFIDESDKKGSVFFAKKELLRNPITIGGPYKLRYALVKN